MKHEFHSKKELALSWASLSDSPCGGTARWRRPRRGSVVTHRQADGGKGREMGRGEARPET